MVDQIIEFETAKTAKKKGFDIPWGVGNSRGVFDAYREDGKLGSCVLSDGLYDIQAPTQSLLQKWLREKHNISISVEFKLDKHPILKYFTLVYNIKARHIQHNRELKNTYEEALEVGLKEGLQLIQTNK